MSPTDSPSAGRFRLDLDSYQLLDSGSPVRLERQPVDLLILLSERRGQLVTREEIASRLWKSDVFVDTDRNINSIVRKLRQAFNDDPDRPEFLETVVGKGYRFVGPLEVRPERPDQAPETKPESSPSPSPSQAPNRVRLWALGVLGSVAIALIVWSTLRTSRSGGAELSPARSIAILPLENLSGDRSQEYFADGMTEELTSELAQAPELRVIAHTSMLQYAGSRKPVSEVARELHVDAVIEGSVLRSGNRVRITAQLIRPPSDQVIWTSTYERDLRDVLSLQRNIAEEVAAQVKTKMALSGEALFGGARPLDPEAHDLYLQGLYHYEGNTEDDMREAITDYQKAIARDPAYADAYSDLGVFYWPPAQAMPQAKAAALKALELNPDLSETHVALGSVYYYEWDWPAAEREATRAIALNPNDAYGRDLLAS
jgi:TolB-like protein/DNA-binding winged helix-turn-helix (wHTH) protein